MSDPMAQAVQPIEIEGIGEVGEQAQVTDGPHNFTVKHASATAGGFPAISIVLECEEEPEAAPIFEKLFLPNPTADPQLQADNKRKIRRAITALGHNPASFVPGDLKGSKIHLTVSGRMYEGERQAQVRWPKLK